jgi:hypothetical protein
MSACLDVINYVFLIVYLLLENLPTPFSNTNSSVYKKQRQKQVEMHVLL